MALAASAIGVIVGEDASVCRRALANCGFITHFHGRSSSFTPYANRAATETLDPAEPGVVE
jgi:hypothetical protein